MKTARLLHTLENQLAQLAAQVAPLAHHATLSARFDRQLFRTRSTLMQDCLEEAQQHFTELRQAVEQQQLPQVAWLAERLVAQVAALSREAAASASGVRTTTAGDAQRSPASAGAGDDA